MCSIGFVAELDEENDRVTFDQVSDQILLT